MLDYERRFHMHEFCWCMFLQLCGGLENIAEKLGRTASLGALFAASSIPYSAGKYSMSLALAFQPLRGRVSTPRTAARRSQVCDKL